VNSPFALNPFELRLAARLGLASENSLRARGLAVALAAFAWLPLLVLSLVAGTAFGDRVTIPFFGDFLVHGRFLIALPLLVLVHPVVDARIAVALAILRRSGVIAPADEESLDGALDRARALWRSWIVRVALLLLSVLGIFPTQSAKAFVEVSSWMTPGEDGAGALSAAGWWSILVGGPVVRLLVLLALWKLLIWCWLLWRLARLPLRYQPLHPDRCAGISMLTWAQCGFAGLVAALSVQLGCLMADAVTYKGVELASFKVPAAAFAVAMLLLLFAPLLVFLRPLADACARTQVAFQEWASRAANQVSGDMQRTGDEAIAAQLSSPEVSSLTDATALYEGFVHTKKIPITRPSFITVIVAIALPMALPLLPLLPIKELAVRLAAIVL
jgi:hypothetical protein